MAVSRRAHFSWSKLLPWALLLILLSVLVWLLRPILLSLVLSLVVYALLSPLNNRFVRAGLGANRSALLILLILILVLTLPLLLLFNNLSTHLQNLPQLIQTSIYNLMALLGRWSEAFQLRGIDIDLAALAQPVLDNAAHFDIDLLLSGSNILLSLLATMSLVPFISFFMIRDFNSLRNRLLALLPNTYFESGWSVYHKISVQLKAYVRGIFLQQSILAAVVAIGLAAFGFPSPIILGVIAGILGLIPYLGPALGTLPPLLIALSMSTDSSMMVIAPFIVIGVAYALDNLLVVPLLIASVVNLHPLLVILGVIVFGAQLGIFGMVMAIPLLAVGNILLSEIAKPLMAR